MKKTLVCFRNTAPYMDFYLYLLLLAVVGAQAQRFKPWEQWSACSETCGVGAQERKRECANGRCVQRETRGCQDIPCPGQGNDTIPQFKKWTSWNRCSKTCGEGVQERTRECTNGKCIQKETQTCRIEVCSGDESLDWKEWSLCTATCGHGVQTRTRQCPVGHCQQKQTKTCYLEPCADTSGSPLTYESWEKWSECSKTCGPGKRSRIRQCTDAPCRETEVGSCMLKPCPGENNIVPGEWETWTTCSATCGYGQKKRRRTCIVGVCEQSQTQNCKIIDCPNETKEYKEWEAWGPCSVTCGVGNQKRRRRCIVGLCEEVMTKTCFAEICPGETPDSLYQAWQQWSECTVSCGGGERRRKRSCKPPGNCVQTQSQTCSQQPCGSGELPQAKPGERFHNWEDWTPCSASCGIGVETRRRRCRVGNCVEVVERSCRLKSCFPDPVSEYESWTPWSECSATCGDGEAKRTRSFPDGSNVQEQLKHCKVKACKIEDPDKYDVWMQWSGCSVSCDTGIQTRVRFCKIGTCRDTETKPCTEEPCELPDLNEKYGSWQSWGECTTTCGFGFTRRKRYCNIGVCEQTQSKTCRIMACPTDYTEWEDWSKCSVTCGSGISTRKRYCTVGTCEEKQQTTCDMEKCGPGWEDWSEWQGCHKSCGGGFDYRIRKCVEQLPSDKCPGDNYDYKRCNTHSCITGIWGPWSEWRECQVTCGTGETIRIRVCEEGQCEGKDRELKPCSTNECIKAQWSEWGDWGECSATCDEGTRTRVRTCVRGEQWSEGCLGSLIMKEACELTPCKKAQWSKWTKWRPCSVTCGKGTRNRERICINGVPGVEGCRGSASSSRSCSKPACKPVKWGDWTQWGECSVSCGGGITVRTRSCDNGKAGESSCIGEETETDTCNVDECVEDLVREWSQWSKWSECSTSCGIGTIFRQRDCVGGNNGCEGDDQEAEICIQDDCVAHWADWSFWTGCSSSCGLGLSLRIRKCEGGSLGDEGCQDGGQETKECTLQSCDEVTTPPTAEPAFWLDWSDWSPCPVTCDKGTQSRSRKCSRSGECVGYSEEARHCNTGECPTDAPVEGGKWTEWEKWGPCNVPCGSGISRRSRSCIDGEIGKGNCQGRRTQYRRCKKEDCEWSTWGDYGECSVTCGKGTQKRSRLCADGAMEITKCLGLSVEIAECTESECPFDPNVICPELPKPINAEVTSTSTAPYKIDAQLTYSCDVGYKLRGASTIRCQRDGRWSGPTPFCAAESCKRDLQRVDIGLTCNDACVTDLDCVGVLQKCECDGWCGKSCFDTEAECYPLPLPENGYIIGDVRTYGYTVTYGCNDGYILHGTATRKCRSDGAWTEREPQCYPYSTPGIAGDVGNIFGESVERVIKGNDAKVGAWPWQVLIMSNENDNFEESLNYLLAGGSVINERYILTAAHVLQKREESHWREHIIIVLGMTLIPTTHISLPDHVQLYQPDSVITHEKFELKNFDFDVALISVGSRLKLQGETLEVDGQAPKRIIFSEFVRPIALPCISACDVSNKFTTDNGITIKAFNQAECLKYGRSLKSVTEDDVVVTGYGDKTRNTLTDQDLDVPDALQQAVLQLQRPERCIDGVKRIRQEYRSARFTSRMLCTSSDEGRDACQGDSGGPLVKQVTSRSGDTCWVQIGIISWGWGCANADKQNITYPGYYADVSSLMPWVVKNMGLGQ